jgi:deoxyribodipyrimidine photo-lyase
MSTVSKKASCQAVYYWFRNDLRLHDHPALTAAIKRASQLQVPFIPVYCFDPRYFGSEAYSEYGSWKCSPRRAQFVLESVSDLQQRLLNAGSNLVVVTRQTPEEYFLANTGTTSHYPKALLFYQEEVCREERTIAKKVAQHFDRQNVQAIWGSTLYELSELPYYDAPESMPDTFTPFRNKVEKKCVIPKPLPTPTKLPPFPADLKTQLASKLTLVDIGYQGLSEKLPHDPRGVMEFVGGETAGLARVKDYIWTKDLLRHYFDTRNGMLGADYSSKFAPWLAHGCISPRFVAQQCQRYEQERVENKSTYWLIFELLWRDFFKFFAWKHGDTLFQPGGTIQSTKRWKTFEKSLQAWKEGKTGYPLVDANMRELNATGFMSNRGRQNVCSFLCLELMQDWRLGADYFESTLLDYDVYSNWGNWCSGAGMTGGRINRFNIVKQSKDYDQHGDYVKHWLPELKDVPANFVHEPWKMTQFQQTEYNCRLGVDYPHPIVKPFDATPKQGPDGKGGRANGQKGKLDTNNPNRSRGQRRDMKSLNKGSYRVEG